MLTQNGLLTDIGSWYLGGAATNNVPESTGSVSKQVQSLWLIVVISAAFSFL
jgi:hypothetical protein